ncbi:hypothetical protein [Anaeromicropila herbilytica]|uniref:Uncharacterized protein n=1 Tax=Anaeromicropila herbilytica TaxID=2785025 RepID=A0A7R7ICT1_9FIRM|nr:hypothetical protein [Anaeromicropila herbilytica]BCN30259.1 hypothetical protein bsdtb5_15540 [Anaeromicropila herbilytica]
MLYEHEEKKYYRFPSKNSLTDFVENGPIYFPSQTLSSTEEKNDLPESSLKRGDIQ